MVSAWLHLYIWRFRSGFADGARGGGHRDRMDTGGGAMWAGHGGGRRGSQDGNPFVNQGDYYQHDTYRS